MINIFEMSMLMTEALDRLITHMSSYRMFYPTIILFNRDKAILPDDVKERYPQISIMEGDTPENAAARSSDIYRTVLTIKLSSYGEEKNFPKIVREIAHKYEPDGIGIVIMSLYREIQKEEKLKTELTLDPEAIQVLHTSFSVKEDREHSYYMTTPYVIKDILPTPVSIGSEDSSFSVLKSEGFWNRADSSSKTLIIPNPYRL
jgi:hypothetical protein